MTTLSAKLSMPENLNDCVRYLHIVDLTCYLCPFLLYFICKSLKTALTITLICIFYLSHDITEQEYKCYRLFVSIVSPLFTRKQKYEWQSLICIYYQSLVQSASTKNKILFLCVHFGNFLASKPQSVTPTVPFSHSLHTAG